MRDAQGDRRGRRPNRPDPHAGPVEAFADQLWQLKIAAGDPSFAEMCDHLGAAASRSSLGAAAQGRTLPSWGVTWEFVRVLAVVRLGHDAAATEREWRTRWNRARAADIAAEVAPTEPGSNAFAGVAPLSPQAQGPTGVTPPHPRADTPAGVEPPPSKPEANASINVAPPNAEVTTPASAAPPSADAEPRVVEVRVVRSARRFRPRVLVAAAVTMVTAVAGVFLFDGGSPEPSKVPPIPLDGSVFEGDVTIPDGSLIAKGESFEKIWRIKNVGKVEWTERYLMRVNDTVCTAPRRVRIPHTLPGHSVDIRVTVEAPKTASACKIFWKMVDADDRLLFPDKRPVFLDVRVG